LPDNADQRDRIPSWIPLAVSVLLVLIGWVANAAKLDSRASELELHMSKLEIRYDAEVVPRKEHEARQIGYDQRLSRIEESIAKVQRSVDENNDWSRKMARAR